MATDRGYDAPLDDPESDAFERRRVAEHVADLACTAPEDWSVRIAIYGSWGEGKTTVAQFAEHSIRDRGHIAFWFRPWSVPSADDLWLQFTLAFEDALSAEGIPLPDSRIAKWRARLERVKPYLDAVTDTNSLTRFTLGGGATLLQNALTIDSDTVRAIRDKLEGRRVVIFVDDIDRMDPKLVPGLLLTFRDLLDLPRFSFVLLFDYHIIIKTLAAYHPAWGRGDHFLEKVVDFPIHLPVLTNEHAKRFFTIEASKYCPFALGNHIDIIKDLLPRNPRRLKQFVRQLATLRSEVERHSDGELNWLVVVCMMLLRLESQRFAANFAESALGREGFLTEHVFPRQENSENHFNDRIDELLDRAAVDADEQRRQIKAIVSTIKRHADLANVLSMRYYYDFTDRPHALTWKEFGDLFSHWKADEDLRNINSWVLSHAEARRIPIESIGCELFETLYNYREKELRQAADTMLEDENARRVKNGVAAYVLMARLYLEGLECCPNGYFTSRANYEKLCSTVVDWVHFDRNDADRKGRNCETFWLRRATREQPDMAIESAEVIMNVATRAMYAASRRRLREDLLNEVMPEVAAKTVGLFRQPGGISALNRWDSRNIYHFALLNRDSLVWQKAGSQELICVLRDAAKDPVVHVNVIVFLHLLETAPRGESRLYEVNAKGLLEDRPIMALLWDAAMARRIQYRARSGIRELRDKLIERGAADDVLPLPDWLGAEEEEE